MIEIIIFAMIAAFVALRLFSVLGRRPEDDAGPRPLPAEPDQEHYRDAEPVQDAGVDPLADMDDGPVRDGLEAIAKADDSFDFGSFKEGALAAYEMILEGFWRGERAAYEPYVSKDIAGDFNAALAERERAGHVVENRLIDIDQSDVVEAGVDGKTAEITMSFHANIVAVTKDGDGEVIDGSLSETYQTRDRWTFTRKLGSRDPNWTVVATESEDA
ncbi:MAG: Tim44/TimA family putative adaptor protein [Pseudomonadota bacterium]